MHKKERKQQEKVRIWQVKGRNLFTEIKARGEEINICNTYINKHDRNI
jgi:hypothetical protein